MGSVKKNTLKKVKHEEDFGKKNSKRVFGQLDSGNADQGKKMHYSKIAPTSKYAISVLLTRHCTSIYLARQFSARYSVLLVML